MGKKPANLPTSIINRIPVRFSYNEDYFNNCEIQGIPVDGYKNSLKTYYQIKKLK